jgi:hypothetical protein
MNGLGKAQPPWAAGPAELLQHGIILINEESESKRRIAMILIDNAAELIMQTFLTLPKRLNGLDISRKERDEICSNFPSLLDGVEKYAEAKIVGLDLGEFEWFHRLRNELYHQGNGLTVEKRNIEVYAELCEKLFEALFSVPLMLDVKENQDRTLLGEFFEKWIFIERVLADWVDGGDRQTVAKNIVELREQGELADEVVMTLTAVQTIRNQLVHGEAEVAEMLRDTNMAKLNFLFGAVKEMNDRKLRTRWASQ